MDIETKHFRVISGRMPGQAEIQDKHSGQTAFLHPSELPPVQSLAQMHERTFDSVIGALFADNI